MAGPVSEGEDDTDQAAPGRATVEHQEAPGRAQAADQLAPQTADQLAPQAADQLAPQTADQLAPQAADQLAPQAADQLAPQAEEQAAGKSRRKTGRGRDQTRDALDAERLITAIEAVSNRVPLRSFWTLLISPLYARCRPRLLS
ncbi:unnamed protein product [Gadus morhua 'NCC']